MLLQFDSVSIAYGDRLVLQEVSFQMQGRSVGLLGPNGAGKTTLLRTILGFLQPLQGDATVLGLDIRSQQQELRQRIGYMPENDCFVSGMNAVSYVAYAGELCGLPRTDAVQRAHEVLQYVGLGEARYRALDTYSSGMKQRLKLAQALVHDPDLLLLDEPTNGMDPSGRRQMLSLIRDIAYEQGIATIVSSHLLPDVETVCEEVVVVHQGRIVMQSRIAELKRNHEQQYDVKIRGSEEAFTQALNARSLSWRRLEEGGFRIVLPKSLSPRLFFEIAQEHSLQIRQLRQMRRSLEDVFAHVVGEEG